MPYADEPPIFTPLADTQIEVGRAARDDAMRRAADHADKQHADWTGQAYRALLDFLDLNGSSPFMTEDVRAFVAFALVDPPDSRAWGAVIKRASRAGLIERIGYGEHKDPIRHRGISAIWRRVCAVRNHASHGI